MSYDKIILVIIVEEMPHPMKPIAIIPESNSSPKTALDIPAFLNDAMLYEVHRAFLVH